MIRQMIKKDAILAERRHALVAALALAVLGFALGLATARADEAELRRAVDDGCANSWTLRLVASPDTVGVSSYACSGCDRQISSADRQAAASQPLQPLQVVIGAPGDRTLVYWRGSLSTGESTYGSVQQLVSLCVPPPYEVRLLTVAPLGYRLCPNSPSTILITQETFDSLRNARMNEGRGAQIGWYFWSCGNK